jgi:dTMP kinase
MAGRFITFEGIEGSGKSTQLGRLLARLRAEGWPAREAREPGGTEVGEGIRRLLLARELGPMSAEAELFLYLASRAQLTQAVIRPALARGEVVVCDRYADSTVAYQGSGRRLDLGRIRDLNRLATGGLVPDLTILLDLPADEGLARLGPPGGGGQDRMEAEDPAFHRRVRAGYLEAAAAEPARFLVLDARRAEGDLAEAIWTAAAGRLAVMARNVACPSPTS